MSVYAQEKAKMYFNTGMKWPENHNGVNDFSIVNANYWVANNQLHIEIEVKDDELIFKGTQLNSDHVEVWFSALENTHQVFKIADPDSGFYTDWAFAEFENEDSTLAQKKQRFIEHEKVAMPFYDYYFSEQEMAHLNVSHVLVSRDLSGTAHYGFFNDSSMVFDIKCAYSLEYVPSKVPDYELEKTNTGYTFKLTCDPSDFFTVGHFPISEIKCNVIFFDEDKDGLSIHTYSNKYEWGEVDYFKKLTLNPSLNSTMPKEWQWLTQTGNHNSNLFGVFNGDNWELRRLIYNNDDWYDFTYDMYWEDVSPTFEYFEIFGDSLVFYYLDGHNVIHKPNTHLWLETEADLDFVKDSAFFKFSDGSFGFLSISYFLQNPYGRGPCGACDHEKLTIQRISENNVDRIFEADANLGNVETWWSEELMMPKEYVPDFTTLKWDNEKQTFYLRLIDEYVGRKFNLEFGWNEKWQPCVFSLEQVAEE